MRHVPAGSDEPGWPWMDPDRVSELLEARGLSMVAAADELGCHPDTLRKWAARHGIDPSDVNHGSADGCEVER